MTLQALDQAKVVIRFEMYVCLSVAMIETGTTVVQRVSCPVIQLCTVCAEMFARRFFFANLLFCVGYSWFKQAQCFVYSVPVSVCSCLCESGSGALSGPVFHMRLRFRVRVGVGVRFVLYDVS